VLILLFAAFSFCYSQQRSSAASSAATIQEVIDEINQDSVRNIIQTMQNFGTRFMLNSNRRQIYKWIMNKFLSFGFTDVTIDSFFCTTRNTTTMQYNVVARLQGTTTPNQYYIIGGHYDSYSTQDVDHAPGADDNASGTAAVIESARVIKKKNWQPASTLLFITFAAEELMLSGDSGSEHYADAAYASGMNIKLMINNDMIANSSSVPEQSYVKINYHSGFQDIMTFAKGITAKYSKVTPVEGVMDQWSDSQSFRVRGFPAVYFEEQVMNTSLYHKGNDVIENYNIPYCTEVIKASCATLLSYSAAATPVEEERGLPDSFTLCQNYPNPFNPSTTIKFSIPQSQFVTIKIYDMLGREVQTLVNDEKPAGTYQMQFNGKNLSSGTYIYRFNSGLYSEAKKFILLK
jgi:hypothetical protein